MTVLSSFAADSSFELPSVDQDISDQDSIDSTGSYKEQPKQTKKDSQEKTNTVRLIVNCKRDF